MSFLMPNMSYCNATCTDNSRIVIVLTSRAQSVEGTRYKVGDPDEVNKLSANSDGKSLVVFHNRSALDRTGEREGPVDPRPG